MSAGTGGRTIQSLELRLDAALAATPGVITSTQPTAAVQQSNANGALRGEDPAHGLLREILQALQSSGIMTRLTCAGGFGCWPTLDLGFTCRQIWFCISTAGGPALVWPWQDVGEVQTFQVAISNDGQEPPLFLSHIAAQNITVTNAAGTAVFTQPALTSRTSGSAVYVYQCWAASGSVEQAYDACADVEGAAVQP